jgi:pimeloyl-ACP methyl ester carboxylesterase
MLVSHRPYRKRGTDVPRVAVVGTVATVAMVAFALVAGCTVGPSRRPSLVVEGVQPTSAPTTSTAGAKQLPPLERPSNSLVAWSDCTDATRQRLGTAAAPPANLTFQCAQVTAPLDAPGAPGLGRQRIELLSVGTGPTPLVMVNDIDGAPGTLYAARLAAALPADFLRTFTLVGVDRRGTGGSQAVRCVPQDTRDRIVGYSPSDTDLTGLLDAVRNASQQCVLDLDTRAAALDAWRSAGDLDFIRQQLGVAHLNAIGHGEGSRVLTTYADRYPDQVGRLVLDGAPEPAATAVDVAKTRAVSAEAAFGAFATDCMSRGCPLGNDPRGALTSLLVSIRTQQLTLPDGAPLTDGAALRAVLIGLADRSSWPTLATAIAAATHGDGTGLATLVRPFAAGTSIDNARLDADLVSGCNDVADRLSPGQVTGAMRDIGTAAPLFGSLIAQQLLWCGAQPVPDHVPPQPTAAGTPPILVLSTANDPVTPESGTRDTAHQLASGVLLSWLGTGHGALGQSTCATTAAQRFLIDGQLPKNLTSCPP